MLPISWLDHLHRIFYTLNEIYQAKQSLKNKKEDFILKETQELENIITEETKNKLQQELEKLHIQNQLEINELLLCDIEELNSKTKEEISFFEKQFIKSKIRKALNFIEFPLLLSFPFIRNKYVMYFTGALFVNNHLNFLNRMFRRKNEKYNPINLSPLKKGHDALIAAIGFTIDNIESLNKLEKEALEKYPELASDLEFIEDISNLKIKLYQNYNALVEKQEVLTKYNIHSKKQLKRLKKKDKIL